MDAGSRHIRVLTYLVLVLVYFNSVMSKKACLDKQMLQRSALRES